MLSFQTCLQILLFVIITFGLYVAYHSVRVYQFLKVHEKHVTNVSERAKQRKYERIPLWLNFSYDQIITQEQFDANVKYFEQNRDKNGGCWGVQQYGLNLIAESCTFLGGARAALLQLTHPMLSHKNIYKST